MYKVIKAFTDLQDDNHVYLVGDRFPHKDATVSKERIEELKTTNNARGEALIKEVKPQRKKSSNKSNKKEK